MRVPVKKTYVRTRTNVYSKNRQIIFDHNQSQLSHQNNIQLGDNFVKVDRHFLPVTKNVDGDWVRTYYEKIGKRISNEVINERTKELDEIRTEVCEYAKEKIHRYFVEAFVEEGVTGVISMDDIKKWWKGNCATAEGRSIMFHVQYGYFEQRPDWEKVLETQYMKGKGLQYVEKSDDDKSMKGCVAKIISREKTEQVKRFQRLRSIIGLSLTKTRDRDEEGRKIKRRKKGEFCVVTVQESENISDLTGSEQNMVNQMEDIVNEAVRRTGLVSEESIPLIWEEIKIVNEEKIKTRHDLDVETHITEI